MRLVKCSHRLQYFTQGVLYNFLCMKVKNIFDLISLKDDDEYTVLLKAFTQEA
jgi:hypothetical protein